MDERFELSRAELHAEVWSARLPDVAQRRGMSESLLRLACSFLDIPLPKRGHWLRAKTPRTRALPRRRRDEAQSVWIRRQDGKCTIEPNPMLPMADERVQAVRIESGHPLVRRAAKHYANPALTANGLMKPRSNSAPCLRVSPTHKARALAFADLLLKGMEERGYTVSWRGAIQAKMPNGELRLTIREEVIKVERPPTPDESARDRYRFYSEPRKYYREQPTGVLIVEPDFGQDWRDNGPKLLESRLDEILNALPIRVDERSEARRQEEERHRAWQEECRRREERWRQERIEDERRERLEKDLVAWKKARKMREFAAALEEAASIKYGDECPDSVKEWITWVNARAEATDPTGKV